MYTHTQIISGPADTEGALDAFVSTVTGPPGPSPIALMPRLADLPVLVLWGHRDPFTPIDGPVGEVLLEAAVGVPQRDALHAGGRGPLPTRRPAGPRPRQAAPVAGSPPAARGRRGDDVNDGLAAHRSGRHGRWINGCTVNVKL